MTANPNPADQLWTHQSASLDQARDKFGPPRRARCVMIQLPTGTGKTKMVVSGINGAISKPARGQDDLPASQRRLQSVAFVVPRRELLWQSGDELKSWGIRHKIVKKLDDPVSFNVHVWCRDTFIRRIRTDQLQAWPDLIIVDEAHLGLKQWLEIKKAAPDHVKFLGVTATPERLDRGDLSQMWDTLITGDQLAWFVENGFLKRPWVLSVPAIDRLEGLDALKRNAAGDVSAAQLAELYKARAKGAKVMYGNEIEHYKIHGQGRSYLIFCRSLIQAEEVAAEFSAAGFATEAIDGTMSDTLRKSKIDRVKNSDVPRPLLGLTTVDLCTYGLDVPKISCLIMLRPTESVALFFQMIGRGLRWDGIFEQCLILDHVGNCDLKKHGHPLEPRAWNWTGKTNRPKPPDGALELISAVDKCPICYDIMINGICRSCGAHKIIKKRADLKSVDGYLIEIQPGEQLPIYDRLPENRREFQDRINSAVTRFRVAWYKSSVGAGGTIDADAVRDLIQVGHDLDWKRSIRQVYYKLTLPDDRTVCTPLLSVIAYIEIPDVKKRYHEKWIEREREFIEINLIKRMTG